MNNIYIKKVYKDKNNSILYVDVFINNKLSRITLNRLIELKNLGFKIQNGVLYKNGILRAKKGKLDVEYIVNKDTHKIDKKQIINKDKKVNVQEIDLDKYKNKKTYDGNTVKFGITYKGIDYIVKPPKNKDYSMYSEDVASRFMRELGYDAHETVLVRDSKRGNVVLLKDFVKKGENLRSYKATGQSSEDTNVTDKSYTYKDIVHMIEKHTKISSEHKKQAIEQFWDMYMLDAVLGNRDRHHGNWGYICKGKEYKISKIYDNGASLFPNVNDKIDEYKRDRKKFLFERCEKFPASLLMVYDKKEGRNKRTNYYEYVGNYKQYKEMEIAYNKIKSFGLERVYEAIKNASSSKLIPVDLRRFYIDIVCIRYMHIIERLDFEESYRRLLNVCK